jgi:lysophospholipase L1-like esterase
MKHSVLKTLLIVSFLLECSMIAKTQTVKIMPLGNSITYDTYSGDSRPTGEKISYRYKLYQLLTAAGHDFDFVGSEDAGSNYLSAEMDDNAGFPGIRDDQLADLISTGYNAHTSTQVTSGPYFNDFPADIILLHIGTNDLTVSPDDVEDILDNIRIDEADAYIIVARIINRKTYDPETTEFNDNVEAMVNARNDSRIIMVDMENGAGINYSTDMRDNLHPNQTGYDSMAYAWLDVIETLNQVPVITPVSEQHTEMGISFHDIDLDTVVTDVEDPDFLLQWTYVQEPSSDLTISIDGNRVLHVSPDNEEWLGSETVWLKVKDSGSGAFPKTDSIEVTFTVELNNSLPIIQSEAILTADDYEEYSYIIEAIDPDDGDIVSYFINQKPEWLEFDAGSHTLSGIPHWNHANAFYDVSIGVTDEIDTIYQDFTIFVSDNDDPPEFTSVPDTLAYPDSMYSYEITFFDKDEDDELDLNLITFPDWLTYIETTNTFYGTPTENELNDQFPVLIKLSDGDITVYQTFVITVTKPTGSQQIENENSKPAVYPNPSNGSINIVLEAAEGDYDIRLLDIHGRMIRKIEKKKGGQTISCDLSNLKKGLYFISFIHSGHTYISKILFK